MTEYQVLRDEKVEGCDEGDDNIACVMPRARRRERSRSPFPEHDSKRRRLDQSPHSPLSPNDSY
ncbi:hypothetical protein B566_EDAN009493, partial [Ephemera danica]